MSTVINNLTVGEDESSTSALSVNENAINKYKEAIQSAFKDGKGNLQESNALLAKLKEEMAEARKAHERSKGASDQSVLMPERLELPVETRESNLARFVLSDSA